MALVAKVTLGFSGPSEELTPRVLDPDPLSGPIESELSAGELAYPGDYVVEKAACDVLVTGHVHGDAPAEEQSASLSLGDWRRDLVVVGGVALRHPLARATVRDRRGAAIASPTPQAPHREQPGESLEGFDRSRLQAAAPTWRIDALEKDATIELEGLSAGRRHRRLRLPGLAPRTFIEAAGQREEVPLRCDTIWIDADFEKIVLVWRGLVPAAMQGAARVVASLEGEERPLEAILGDLPRGTVAFAEEEVPICNDPDELEMARWEVLEHCAPPELTLADLARISAALAENRQPRERELAAQGLDERAWTIEERAWSERMARALDRGDATLAERFGNEFDAAQAALAGPHEPRDLETYARAMLACEGAEDLDRALAAVDLHRGEWMRLSRHWRERASREPAIAEELETIVLRLTRAS